MAYGKTLCASVSTAETNIVSTCCEEEGKCVNSRNTVTSSETLLFRNTFFSYFVIRFPIFLINCLLQYFKKIFASIREFSPSWFHPNKNYYFDRLL